MTDRIKSLSGEDSVENVKKDIDEIEMINIDLDHSVAKLLSEKENLRKEREHLKSIYKDQFDSIRKTHVQSKEHCASLIAQVNAKSVENSDLNAQLQEKVFAIAALKNELKKLKEKNVVDTVILKPSATIAPGMTPEKQSSYESEKEAISFDIDWNLEMKIYSNCSMMHVRTAQEMWEAIERLHQRKVVQLQAEQSDWLADTYEEIDVRVEAHYSLSWQDSSSSNADSGTDAESLESVETGDSNIDVDENKKIQKQLKKANATLTQELTECKSILAETSRTLGESNSIRDSCLVALQNKQTGFERYKSFNDRTVDYDKLEHKLNDALGLIAQKEIDIKEGLKVKAYEISVVKEKHDELVKQSLFKSKQRS
ncbi:hypothetical protein Tco_1187190 [Tanacetum coccineum]